MENSEVKRDQIIDSLVTQHERIVYDLDKLTDIFYKAAVPVIQRQINELMNADPGVTGSTTIEIAPNRHDIERGLRGSYSPFILTLQRTDTQSDWGLFDLLNSMPESTPGSFNVHALIAPGADLRNAATESRNAMVAAGAYGGDDRIQLTSPNTIHIIVSKMSADRETKAELLRWGTFLTDLNGFEEVMDEAKTHIRAYIFGAEIDKLISDSFPDADANELAKIRGEVTMLALQRRKGKK